MISRLIYDPLGSICCRWSSSVQKSKIIMNPPFQHFLSFFFSPKFISWHHTVFQVSRNVFYTWRNCKTCQMSFSLEGNWNWRPTDWKPSGCKSWQIYQAPFAKQVRIYQLHCLMGCVRTLGSHRKLFGFFNALICVLVVYSFAFDTGVLMPVRCTEWRTCIQCRQQQ